jgi:hypothetical protein
VKRSPSSDVISSRSLCSRIQPLISTSPPSFYYVRFHYRNKLLHRRPIPKPTAFYQGRPHRPWPRAWPKFGRRLRYAVGVDYSGDLTRRQSRRVTYFHFLIAFSVLQKIKENS